MNVNLVRFCRSLEMILTGSVLDLKEEQFRTDGVLQYVNITLNLHSVYDCDLFSVKRWLE